mmetsp:Transcript_32879/g.69182  ORF Transcript_32879/g.69182 Transcript_32879/m.69182 type:complete len:312 (-) Transcript_32879:184-1119(-)
MSKSLHRSLEAKLASIKDPEHSESDDNEGDEPETISAKSSGKGTKRKGKKNDAAAQSADDEDTSPSTVIYLGHLPVGFEEREITVFLNQFGNVSRCRVSRSTKTGRSRGFAFVDFADPDVTEIVAETMSGYFLLEKRLVCHVLPNDKVHELMFARPKRVPTKADKQKKARAEVNQIRTADAMKGITSRLVKREEMKRKKLEALGIKYDFPGYAASAQSMSGESNTVPKKKKRKMSVGDEEEIATNNNKAKTPKSQKKKKSKKADVEVSGEEKENDTAIDHKEAAAAATEEPAKKKKKSKTPSKKGKTPKKK